MAHQLDGEQEPRVCLLGTVRLVGDGVQPLNEREAAAARRLLVLIILVANPLRLDDLRLRLFGDSSDSRGEQLAAEIRRARSAVSHALGDKASLLMTRPGETELSMDLVERTDLLLVYSAAQEGRWSDVSRLLRHERDVLRGVSEFSYVYDHDAEGQLRIERLCAEHRRRVAQIRWELEARHPTESLDAETQGDGSDENERANADLALPNRLGASAQEGSGGEQTAAADRRATRRTLRARATSRQGLTAIALLVVALIAAVLLLRSGSNKPEVTQSSATATSATARATVQKAEALTATRPEITGGAAHVWSDYTIAGGQSATALRPLQVVRISCRVKGFVVPDHNPWWYLLASSPYDKAYFATADAFYNHPRLARGSFKHSAFVDPSVPICP
jgi:hypothetical protein